MNQSVARYVNRYINGYQDKIRRICDPLKAFGISYFTYHSLTHDGLWRPLVSRPDWAEHYTAQQIYQVDPFILNPRCYQSGSILWNQYIDEPFQKEVLKVAEERFNMSHSLCLIERHEKGCEFFGFSAIRNQNDIYGVYISQQQLLKQFCRYFKQELAPVLKLMKEDPIDLMPLKGKQFKEAKEFPFKALVDSNLMFLKQIQIERSYKLSNQEKKCLSYYLDEPRMAYVADQLNLSIRTIETYLVNLKHKLNCSNKLELLKKGQELRSLGLIP